MVLSGRNHHHYDRRDVPIRKQGGHRTKVKIGCDVWLGAGVRVTCDVADGTVVGTGSVVTKTYEPYAVLVGVPAKPVGWRGQSLHTDVH
jgi:acetyltransferase-like isoleucine patch superfamily enzyme